MRTIIGSVRRLVSSISFGLVPAALAVAIACAETGSEGIETKKLCPDAKLEAADASATITVKFQIECGLGGTVVDLEGADKVSCDGKRLNEKRNPISGAYYELDVALKAPGEKYDCTFEREDEQVPFSVAAPAPFELTAPATGSTAHFGQPLDVAWSPSGTSAKIEARLTGPCLESDATSSGDDKGKLRILASELRPHPDGPSSCDASLKVVRETMAKMPKAFAGGTIYSDYVATTSVELTE
ncbi:MAG TPA: hypothetical protein VGD74_10475 [Vulgatibacter sp.]